ncbi:MAG: hypothetical protein QOI66_4567 [Myxococcales bacterium]|jgi:hypothetical protein|nr:hypothetical protein [Myxococcales bacterium]
MLQLRSSNSEVEIQFSDVVEDYFRVSVVARDHSASRKVYAYTDAHGVVKMFAEAARDWKGWQGAKVWQSLEGELRLELRADHLGHVSLRAEIRSDPGGADPWRLDAEVGLDSGQLDSIVAGAKALWGNGG